MENKGHKAPFCQHKCSTSCYGWFSLFVQMELAIKRTDNVYPLKVQWQSIEEEYKERKTPDKESSPEWLNEDLVLRVLTFSFTSVLIYHFWWSVSSSLLLWSSTSNPVLCLNQRIQSAREAQGQMWHLEIQKASFSLRFDRFEYHNLLPVYPKVGSFYHSIKQRLKQTSHRHRALLLSNGLLESGY